MPTCGARSCSAPTFLALNLGMRDLHTPSCRVLAWTEQPSSLQPLYKALLPTPILVGHLASWRPPYPRASRRAALMMAKVTYRSAGVASGPTAGPRINPHSTAEATGRENSGRGRGDMTRHQRRALKASRIAICALVVTFTMTLQLPTNRDSVDRSHQSEGTAAKPRTRARSLARGFLLRQSPTRNRRVPRPSREGATDDLMARSVNHARFVRIVSRVATRSPVVFLTVDDGWVEPPDLIQFLRSHRVALTAFLTDEAIATDYRWFRKLSQLGVDVQSHAVHHRVLRGLTPAVQRREICESKRRLRVAVQADATMFRPPFGEFDAATRRAAARCGMISLVTWDVVMDDAGVHFRKGRKFEAGDIILLHFSVGLVKDLKYLLRRIRIAGFEP